MRKLIEFFRIIDQLKNVERYGSSEKMTPEDKDSSADHSWRLAMMVMIVSSELDLDLDTNKSMKLALIHDLPEAICGDVDRRDVLNHKISEEDKDRRENQAMQKLLSSLPNKSRKELSKLWDEYKERKTKESIFVKAMDRIETTSHLLTASEGSYDVPDLIATYVHPSAKEFPQIKKIVELIQNDLKSEYRKRGIKWKDEYDLK